MDLCVFLLYFGLHSDTTLVSCSKCPFWATGLGALSDWLQCPSDLPQSFRTPILALHVKFGFLPHLRTEIALRSFTLQWSLGCQAKVSFSVLCLPDLSVTTLLISFLQIPFHFLKVYYGIFKHKQSQRKEHKGPPGIRLPAPRIFNILLILFHAPPLPCSATGLLYRKPNQ